MGSTSTWRGFPGVSVGALGPWPFVIQGVCVGTVAICYCAAAGRPPATTGHPLGACVSHRGPSLRRTLLPRRQGQNLGQASAGALILEVIRQRDGPVEPGV